MSHAHSESDSFDSAVVVPDVLDTTYITTVPQGLGSLANRTRYLLNTIDSASAGTVAYTDVTPGFASIPVPDASRYPSSGALNPIAFATRSLMGNLRQLRKYVWGCTESTSYKAVPIAKVAESDGDGAFAHGDVVHWWANATHHEQLDLPGTAPDMYWPVQGLPPTGTIVLIAARIQGASSHSALPSVMPKLSLLSRAAGTIGVTTFTTAASVTDTSGSTTPYQTEHALLLSDLNIVIQQNTEYYFRFEGESGTNALTGLRILTSYIAINA